MRSKILIPAVATLSAVLPAGAVAAHAHAGHPEARAGQTTWHLVVKSTGQRIVGKTYLESEKVSRHATGFGLALLTCPGAAQAGVKVARCALDLGTRGGTVRGALRLDNTTGAVSGTVTGGTGRFAGVSGTITGQGQKSGARLVITLKGL
ncbi:MAG: hypothetical protein WAV00_02820 [Nocardioides sp.]